jgi:ribosomal protein S1
MNPTKDLELRFGDFSSPEKTPDWELLKTRLPAGSRVSGEVVARYIFGIFLDIGVGFPALLEVIQFEEARRRRYNFEDYPAVGSTVTARVVSFRERVRQIDLTQLDPHPHLDGRSSA